MSAWDIEGQKRLHEIINERLDLLEKKLEKIIIPKDWDDFNVGQIQENLEQIANLEEVLRKLIKKHKIKPTPGYTIMDPKTKSFNIELDKLLEKLDSKSGGEKVEESSKVSVTANVSMQEVGLSTKSGDDSKLPEPENYKNYVANSPRFHIRKGKWGMYFYDNELDESIPLQKVIDWLNIFYSKKQRLIEVFIKDIEYYTDGCDDGLIQDEESVDHKYWIKIQERWQKRSKE